LFFNRLRFGNGDGRGSVIDRRGRWSGALNTFPHEFGDWLVDGTGVSLLLGDAELRQHLKDAMRGDLELPGQLVDSNFAHIDSNALVTRRLTDFLRVLYGIKFALVI
jgi:hypothetical protein